MNKIDVLAWVLAITTGFVGLAILNVCLKIHQRRRKGELKKMKPKAKIPFFIRKLQCSRCLLKNHVACSVWGRIVPPVWTIYIFGLHLCGSFKKEAIIEKGVRKLK